MQNYFRDIVIEEVFEEHPKAVLNRLDELESLARTKKSHMEICPERSVGIFACTDLLRKIVTVSVDSNPCFMSALLGRGYFVPSTSMRGRGLANIKKGIIYHGSSLVRMPDSFSHR
ncbi:hypothetical protein J1614_009730 [Plenodomus biglobosus]|nr:hypothetical protein J1614_009730 [Plenodomus biglobosus]